MAAWRAFSSCACVGLMLGFFVLFQATHSGTHSLFFISTLGANLFAPELFGAARGHAMGCAKQTALFPLQLQDKDSAESHRRTKLSSASPIYSMQIKISADVLSPVRKNGQFTVFEDKVNI